MANFQEVSLGFAEFVSQLIQETFDAVLSSQNYQLEKYAELQNRLNLPNGTFAELFITPEQVSTKAYLLIGKVLAENMPVDQDLQAFLDENIDTTIVSVNEGNLTRAGFNAVQAFVTEILVEEQKTLLNTLINQSSTANLVVDSGQIITKLELSNLYATEEDGTTTVAGTDLQRLAEAQQQSSLSKDPEKTSAKLTTDPKLSDPKLTDPKLADTTLTNPKLTNPDELENTDPKVEGDTNSGDSSDPTDTPTLGDTLVNPNLDNDLDRNTLFLPSYDQNLNVVEHRDLDTGTTTIMIDKQALDQLHHSNLQIPNVRLAVKPTKITGSSNLYSEVKINFKTV